MRAGLALIAMLALAAAPAAAQGKVKVPVGQAGVEMIDICEHFASGDVLAVDDAIGKGWDAYDQDSDTPYVQTFAGSKDLPGIGSAELFVLLESYPGSTFGYCRIDVSEPTGNGEAAMQAIKALDRYTGETQTDSNGIYASLNGTTDTNRMLLAHWSDESFTVQLSIMTPKTAKQ